MKIVADENIPYVKELFGPLGDVFTLAGRNVSPDDLEGADILLVRSVTRVTESLLRQSAVKFVGTCTIGVDHLDVDYLREKNIAYASAPGCNANAVVQYVLSAITHLKRTPFKDKKVVIVGGGNVGSRVYDALLILGFDCVCVDPFFDASKTNMRLTNIEAIYSADIVCFHTPLTMDGEHPTHHLLHGSAIERLKPGTLVLNAGRGAVIDNDALLQALKNNANIEVVLDVWEDEPDINTELLKYVALGTPHIAGYSFEGRLTGSLMIFDALCQVLNRDESVLREKIKSDAFGKAEKLDANNIEEAIGRVYDIRRDYDALLAAVATLPASFDKLRKYYPQRREYSHFLAAKDIDGKTQLSALGFQNE